MYKPYSRKPKNYDGTEVTTHHLNKLLPEIISNIGEKYDQRADLILMMWPDIVGPSLAPMTQAVSFNEGVLVVKVKNSTLHSILNQSEKPRLLKLIRQKFPRVTIKTVCFRIG